MLKLKRILLGIIVVGIIVAGYQITLRVAAEQRNTVVEIVADLDSFISMSKKMGKSLNEVTQELIKSGVNSIAVSETTVAELEEKGKIAVYENSEIKNANVALKKQNLFNDINNYIINNGIDYTDLNLIITENEATYNFVNKALNNRYPNKIVTFSNQGVYGILLNTLISSINSVSLGIMEEDLEMAKGLKFTNIVPRIENYRELTTAQVDEIYDLLKKYKVKTIIFAGSQVLGFDSVDEESEKLQYIGEKFSQQGAEIITAILEKPSDSDLESAQRGITKLAKYSDYVNTKVFSVDEAQLAKLRPIDVVEQWGRAISQRNVRIIYLRPINISYKTAEQNFESTITAVKEIDNRLEGMGMKSGTAKAFGIVKQNVIVKTIIAIAVFAGGLLVLTYFFEEKWWMHVGLVLGCGFIAIIH